MVSQEFELKRGQLLKHKCCDARLVLELWEEFFSPLIKMLIKSDLVVAFRLPLTFANERGILESSC